jgi:hypothetical protein
MGPKNATHNMVYLYDACDQISDFWEKCDEKYFGRTDRGKTVYTPPPSGSGGIKMYGQILHINDHIKYENYEFISQKWE